MITLYFSCFHCVVAFPFRFFQQKWQKKHFLKNHKTQFCAAFNKSTWRLAYALLDAGSRATAAGERDRTFYCFKIFWQ
jgi:hypothetical protein